MPWFLQLAAGTGMRVRGEQVHLVMAEKDRGGRLPPLKAAYAFLRSAIRAACKLLREV